ncbi:MAG: hypothetical protein LBT26_09585 [Clostridiales Family XIII bacterium]|nr:hypothetical protein [Clostridiales Family XIII bacterium]
MLETVKTLEEIMDNLHQFMRIRENRDNIPFKRFASFRHWYYFPAQKAFAPNKFLRYRGTTLENYGRAPEHDDKYGDSTDSTLTKYFRELKTDSEMFECLFSDLKGFAQEINAKPRKSVKIYMLKKDASE